MSEYYFSHSLNEHLIVLYLDGENPHHLT